MNVTSMSGIIDNNCYNFLQNKLTIDDVRCI